MSRIDELIQQLCPNGVEYKPLGDIVNILDSQRKPISKEKRIPGKIPYYGANGIQGYVKDFIFDGIFLLIGEDGSVINKDGSPVLNWAEGKIWVNNHAHILTEKKDIASLRFIFFFLQTYDVTPVVRGTPPKMTQQSLREIMIPVPPLPVQEEIVRILGKFTALEAELEAELEARRKQYEFYRDQLLTFGDEVEWKPLGEVCDYVDYRGKTPQKTDKGIFLVTAKNIRRGFIDYSTSKEYISKEDYATVMHRGKPEIGDVLITTEAPCGFVAQVDRPNIALAQRVIKYRSRNPELSNCFLKFFLLGKCFQEKLDKAATGSTVKGIKGSKLHKLTIPIPPLAEQERIVAILDKFDALVNDISSGLPAELEMRRKQYEYYRDRLLTFKPLAKEA